jgi:hypothetical protein
MPLIKDVKLPLTLAQRRVQATAWACIYAGLLTVLTGYTLQEIRPSQGWDMAENLMLAGSLVTAVGAALIYIRSRMK